MQPLRPTPAHTVRNSCVALAGVLCLIGSGCVTTSVQRMGRMELGNGHEGLVPVYAAVDYSFEHVAVITVEASAVKTTERRIRHLRRRASLLGCDGVVSVRHLDANRTQGTCVRQKELALTKAAVSYTAAAPSITLRERAAAAGPAGIALLQVLEKAAKRKGDSKTWPLKWYLEAYPDSPFYDDVEALLIVDDVADTAVVFGGTPGSIRTAPQAPSR